MTGFFEVVGVLGLTFGSVWGVVAVMDFLCMPREKIALLRRRVKLLELRMEILRVLTERVLELSKDGRSAQEIAGDKNVIEICSSLHDRSVDAKTAKLDASIYGDGE